MGTKDRVMQAVLAWGGRLLTDFETLNVDDEVAVPGGGWSRIESVRDPRWGGRAELMNPVRRKVRMKDADHRWLDVGERLTRRLPGRTDAFYTGESMAYCTNMAWSGSTKWVRDRDEREVTMPESWYTKYESWYTKYPRVDLTNHERSRIAEALGLLGKEAQRRRHTLRVVWPEQKVILEMHSYRAEEFSFESIMSQEGRRIPDVMAWMENHVRAEARSEAVLRKISQATSPKTPLVEPKGMSDPKWKEDAHRLAATLRAIPDAARLIRSGDTVMHTAAEALQDLFAQLCSLRCEMAEEAHPDVHMQVLLEALDQVEDEGLEAGESPVAGAARIIRELARRQDEDADEMAALRKSVDDLSSRLDLAKLDQVSARKAHAELFEENQRLTKELLATQPKPVLMNPETKLPESDLGWAKDVGKPKLTIVCDPGNDDDIPDAPVGPARPYWKLAGGA
jgi:hypothetical protein